MTNRLFIALEVPHSILDQIIAVRDSVYGIESKVRWEPREKLHITLKFLGDTELSQIKNIIDGIGSVTKNHKALDLEFSRFGMFYRDKNPSVLWLGLYKNILFAKLFEELENSLIPFGIKKENREFKPHLTILRMKGNENLNKLRDLIALDDLTLKFNANKIILFKSTLLKTGSVYEEIENFLLK